MAKRASKAAPEVRSVLEAGRLALAKADPWQAEREQEALDLSQLQRTLARATVDSEHQRQIIAAIVEWARADRKVLARLRKELRAKAENSTRGKPPDTLARLMLILDTYEFFKARDGAKAARAWIIEHWPIEESSLGNLLTRARKYRKLQIQVND